jgi:hypothetical protein
VQADNDPNRFDDPSPRAPEATPPATKDTR